MRATSFDAAAESKGADMVKHYSEIVFKERGAGFQHNLEGDFGCFALWEAAKPLLSKIRDLLSKRFQILLESEVEWSTEYFHSNASRLYETPIYDDLPHDQQPSPHASKIGGRRFSVFVVSDVDPKYTFAMSVSGDIELCNLNIVRTKYEIREWIFKHSGARYGVHSTNNVREFFTQVPLLLGADLFERLLVGVPLKRPGVLVRDLEGAGGWKSYEDLFRVLNLTNNYMVLRNFSGLPHVNEDEDIDLLTDNYQRMASTLGGDQVRGMPYKCCINIGGASVPVDIRFIGDKYYDAAWEKDMLSTKSFVNGVYVPRSDHYFFSLLFHCKVQKQSVKEKYVGMLSDVAGRFGFDWFSPDALADDDKIIDILRGYFCAHGYHYARPLDPGVYENVRISHGLPVGVLVDARPAREHRLTRVVKQVVKRVLPESVVRFLKAAIPR